MILGGEVFHRLKQLAELGWWPKSFNWLRAEILQLYEGDVTIVPRLSWSTLSKAIDNPDAQLLSWFAMEGERGTYPYLSVIETRCKIELALHSATVRLRESMTTPRTSPDVAAWRRGAFNRPAWITQAVPTTRKHIPPKRRSPPPASPTTPPMTSLTTTSTTPTRSQYSDRVSLELLDASTEIDRSPLHLGRLSPGGSLTRVFRRSPSFQTVPVDIDSSDEVD